MKTCYEYFTIFKFLQVRLEKGIICKIMQFFGKEKKYLNDGLTSV